MPEDTDPPTCPHCGGDLSDTKGVISSTEKRWKYTGTILALLTVASLPIVITLTGLGIITLGAITQGWWVLYSTVVLMAATWTFGKETLEVVRKARKK